MHMNLVLFNLVDIFHEIEQEADDGCSFLHVMLMNYQFMSDTAHDLLKA